MTKVWASFRLLLWMFACLLGFLIHIWISNFGYGNTHMIIENGAQTVGVCASCLETEERVIQLCSASRSASSGICPIWLLFSSVTSVHNISQCVVAAKTVGRPLQRHLLISFHTATAPGLDGRAVGHVPCAACPSCLFPFPSGWKSAVEFRMGPWDYFQLC